MPAGVYAVGIVNFCPFTRVSLRYALAVVIFPLRLPTHLQNDHMVQWFNLRNTAELWSV